MVMPVMDRFAVPLFVTVNVCGALVVPALETKVSAAVCERVTAGRLIV